MLRQVCKGKILASDFATSMKSQIVFYNIRFFKNRRKFNANLAQKKTHHLNIDFRYLP